MMVRKLVATGAVALSFLGVCAVANAAEAEKVEVAGVYESPLDKGQVAKEEGAEAAPESRLSLGLAVDYASRYIWRGFDLLEDNSPAVQPSVSVSYALTDKLSLGYSVWGNLQLVSDNENFAGEENDFNEFDHTVNATYALNDEVELELGYIYYYYPSTPSGTDTQEVYAGVSIALNDYLSTGGKLYYDFDEGDGIYAKLTVDAEYPLNDKVNATASAGIGYMDYDNDYFVEGGISEFSDLPLSVGFTVDMGHGLSAYTTANYSFTLADDVDHRVDEETGEEYEVTEVNEKDEFWVMVGIAYEF